MIALIFIVIIKAKYTTKRPLDVARDAWREIMRTAYRITGLHWVATYLAKHFLPGAGAKYKYRLRSKAYRARKDAKLGKPWRRGGDIVIGGSNRPNVLTGYMMRAIQSQFIVRGFPTRATVHLLGPSYFTMRFRMNQPNKGKEITTLLPNEKADLSRVLRGAVLKQLAKYRGQKSVEL